MAVLAILHPAEQIWNRLALDRVHHGTILHNTNITGAWLGGNAEWEMLKGGVQGCFGGCVPNAVFLFTHQFGEGLGRNGPRTPGQSLFGTRQRSGALGSSCVPYERS